MKPASDTADMESIIDDVQEALRWKPILPLLKATREALPEARTGWPRTDPGGR
jgi:hypothetical protein